MFGQEAKVIRALAPLLRPYSGRMSLFVVLAFLESISEGIGISLFIPLLSSLDESTFNTGSNTWLSNFLGQFFVLVPPSRRLPVIALSIFGLVLARSILSYSASLVSARIDMRLDHHLRRRVLDQFFRVGVREIEKREPGKLMNTLEDVTVATSQAIWTLFGLIINAWTILVLTILLLLLSWRLTLLVLAALVLVSVVLKLLTRRVETVARKSLAAHQALSQRALELLKGLRTIRAFGREAHEREEFSKVSWEVSQQSYEFLRISSLISPLGQLLAAVILIAVLMATLKDPSNLPAVLVFVFILYRLHPQVLAADESRNALVAAGPYVEELRSLLDETDKEYIASGSIVYQTLQEVIRFDEVTFRYGVDQPWAIDGVSFEIAKGSTVALVGPSGAGKSTLISLLLRLYDPDSGDIFVDSTPLRDLDLENWRSGLALASQDTYIFNASLRDNIAYGRLEASDEEIVSAARLADAHDFISALPNGYETVAGDQGVRLSAGQRQRVALARAIVRRAGILVLDEAINALDSISEHVIHGSIRSLPQDSTVIIIAHRLSTIELADHVLVLEAGRVQEQGSAQELLQNKSLFNRFYELQQSQLQSFEPDNQTE